MVRVPVRAVIAALTLCCVFMFATSSLVYAEGTAEGTGAEGTAAGGIAAEDAPAQQTPVASKHAASKKIVVTSLATKGSSEAVNAGKVGKKGATLKGLTVTNISSTKGSVSYKVNTVGGSWTGWVKDGAAAADGGKLEAVKIKLSGKLGKKYDVYYRVYTKTYGWLGWAKNGQSAGTAGIGKAWRAQALQVQLVKKGKKAPGYTKIRFSGSKGWITKMTGSAKLDKAIYKLAQKKKTIRACYDWVKSHKHTNWYGAGKKRYNNGTRKWYKSEASRMMFGKPTDCYAFAATFTLLTNALGYDSKVVCGYVPSRSLGQAAHGWVEIKLKGKTYVYDPDLGHSYPSRNFYKFTYKHAPTKYKIDKKKD